MTAGGPIPDKKAATALGAALRKGGYSEDAVLELLGPASQDSPIRQRPQGLVSMASWEVGDLDVAVRPARGAGFTVSDPAAGPGAGCRSCDPR